MPTYEIRLYKQVGSSSNKHQVVDKITFEAADDADAIAKMPAVQVPKFENSDYAILFDFNSTELLRLDAA